MSTTTATGSQGPALSEEGAVTRFLRATELDTRTLGMIAALLVIWAGFDIYGGMVRPGEGLFGGSFLTARNIWVLLVQTSSIAIMATGMVLIIVMRQIDLSVGSMLSLIAVSTGYLQVYHLGPALGVGNPAIWIIAVLFALALGALVGCLNGVLIAYLQIPSFIVTLGGLIAYGGLAFWVARGETVAPMDQTFALFGGNGPLSWVGPTWSWVLAALACVGILVAIIGGRTQRRRFKFPLRPIWAEAFLVAMGSIAVLLITWVVNSYPWAPKVVEKYATDNKIPIPQGVLDPSGEGICQAADKVVRCVGGLSYETGYTIPVLIAIAVGGLVTFLAGRTRFGRYIYATGGNPEAAELAGINTKRLTVMVFTLMGCLVACSAIISSARLNAATNNLGLFNELYVISAAVIGGTSLAGGIGTIYGAMLGALVMQSLQSGMTLLNFDTAVRDMVVGFVLVFAVFLDQLYRRRVK
jgi:D-xylose transport system permease protein